MIFLFLFRGVISPFFVRSETGGWYVLFWAREVTREVLAFSSLVAFSELVELRMFMKRLKKKRSCHWALMGSRVKTKDIKNWYDPDRCCCCC
jgi:hypothetical protein